MPRHSLDDSYLQEDESEILFEDTASNEADSVTSEGLPEDTSLENRPASNQPLQRLLPSKSDRNTPPYYKPMARTVTGNVVHSSGEELARPVDFPRRYNIILIMLVIVAAIVGAILFSQYYSNVVNGTAKEQEQVQAYLTRGVDLDLPVLTDYVDMGDDEIRASLKNTGYQIHDVTNDSGSLDLIKSPSDLNATEAATLYSIGIEKLSPSDAAKLLCGFWRLDTNRTDGFTIRVRYVDFNSGDISKALTNCLSDEKIDTSTMTEEGEDSSGNTYRTGVVEVNGSNYQWRASAIPLSKVYDIALPSNSIYIGFKLTRLG